MRSVQIYLSGEKFTSAHGKARLHVAVRSAPYAGRSATAKLEADGTLDGLSRSGSSGRVSRFWLGRALAAPEGALLLLRAFLGVTFVFAGGQKLANPNFLSATAPGSFQEQLRGSMITSPLHHFLAFALHAPVLIAVVIALGEIAVGLGTLLGLFGRLAAIGGALLSLSFFLTVSFRDSPYYYGPDIVFLFAWTPFVLGGSGTWSLDHVYASRAVRVRETLEVNAQPGASRSQLAVSRRRAADAERRIFLQKASAASLTALVGTMFGGLTAGIGRLVHTPQRSGSVGSLAEGVPSTTSPTMRPIASPTTRPITSPTTSDGSASKVPGTSAVPPASTAGPVAGVPQGAPIGLAADVPIGGAASFTDPAQQVPALVVQVERGQFRAFSAVCPHAGCTVQFDGTNDVFACPCHGSVFNATTGAVLRGPATTGLSAITVSLGPNGQLYADG
jgi:thiosulfate dehydrogenase [quinone] large subunit